MSEGNESLALTTARIEAKLDVIGVKIDNLSGISIDHESRIRALEKKVWAASGAAAIIGGALSQLFVR